MRQDDREGLRTIDDDNFIDDTGVDPADRYGSDNEPHSPGSAPQVFSPQFPIYSLSCICSPSYSAIIAH